MLKLPEIIYEEGNDFAYIPIFKKDEHTSDVRHMK